MTNLSRYGPWAVIAGASEGVGAAFARRLAADGVAVVLVARREGPLHALEQELADQHGVAVRSASIDLSAPDAHDALFELTAELDVGLFIANAGADEHMASFLDRPADEWAAMLRRNCELPMRAAHHYAGAMVGRGGGGIILVSSGAAWAGSAHIAAYGATKAFDLVLGEALWAELGPYGVDVLSLVLGATDTPALRRLLDDKGVAVIDLRELGGLADPADVVAEAFAHLGDGPTHIVGAADLNPFGAVSRREAVTMMSQASAQMLGR